MIARIWIMFLARTREFYRDRGGLAWNILFPLMIIGGFAFAFSGGGQKAYKIGVYPPSALFNNDALFTTKHIDFIGQSELSAAIEKVGRQQLDLVIAWGDTLKYWINTTSPKGYLSERIIIGSTNHSLLRQEASGKQVRYVDWLVPGILAMNMMFSALFGVGWVIVRYRINGVLKRLKATPLRAYEFITAHIFSRMIVILGSSLLVFIGANFFLAWFVASSHGGICFRYFLHDISRVTFCCPF
jgi:ABC-2 type transport system permease protein